MILVFSDPKDYSSSKIIEWLFNIQAEFIIIDMLNKSDFIDMVSADLTNPIIIVNGREFPINKISSIFYRRSAKKFEDRHIFDNFASRSLEDQSFLNYIGAHITSKNELLNYFFKKIKVFGNEHVTRINKILVLREAKSQNLLVPETLVTTRKCEVIEFYEKFRPIINKSLDIGYFFIDRFKNQSRINYTSDVHENDLEIMPQTFPLSVFQRKINKAFEVRCFCFDEKFYCTAIFSQTNDKTKVDYRNYDYDFPNREVPFTLPEDIQIKLRLLMKAINLNTGSIDLIMDGNDYYFLEINPVGQFDNVSTLGNWYIEKRIAKYLANG